MSESIDARPEPRLGVGSSAFMVCASMIGTGVFTSLGYQAGLPFSPFDLLLLWTVGGFVALCGALAYGELALRMPRSGGECRFLDEMYGPLAGFLAGWISLIAGFAASIAACAFALASYATPLLDRGLEKIGFESGTWANRQSLSLVIAATVVVGLGVLQRLRVEHVMRFQNVFVFLKIALVAGFLAFAFSIPHHQPISFMPTEGVWRTLVHPGFAVSLVFVSFAYSGWNAAVYIADDVKNPARTLPRALMLGTGSVTILYVLLNAAFLWAAPRASIINRPDVAFVAAEHIWGRAGGALVAAAISIGLISSVSSLIWAGGSVAETMGEMMAQPVESAAPRLSLLWLTKRNRNGRPTRAVALICAMALTMLATSSFDSVIKLIGVLLAGCASLSAFGVFILDRRSARTPGARRTPLGAKLAAGVFLSMNAWVLSYLFIQEPASCAAALATVSSGIAVYYAPALWSRVQRLLDDEASGGIPAVNRDV